MADFTFKTPAGQTIGRDLMLLYLNTGTSESPVWSPIGKRVEDSSVEFDWSTETKTDIFGDTYTTSKKAKRTQTFDPCELDAGDAAQLKIWQLAVVEDNPAALNNLDVLLVHAYATDSSDKAFSERYPVSSITPSSLGGEGGGFIGMPINVIFGGTRSTGTSTISGKTVTFTAD